MAAWYPRGMAQHCGANGGCVHGGMVQYGVFLSRRAGGLGAVLFEDSTPLYVLESCYIGVLSTCCCWTDVGVLLGKIISK